MKIGKWHRLIFPILYEHPHHYSAKLEKQKIGIKLKIAHSPPHHATVTHFIRELPSVTSS